jgi:GDPmannose 4,6-dehydratase
MTRALIFGIGGQDGAFLASLLLAKGYEVFGTSRDVFSISRRGLQACGIETQVQLQSTAINDFRSVIATIKAVMPTEIYNLAGQSSVGLSFEQPVETFESFVNATLNILEAIRFLNKDIRFYNAGSSECFGDTGGEPANESTAFRPRSPYAVAKAAAFWQVANYREAYGLHASSGILFNHESPLRPDRFVTQKIIDAACRIAMGLKMDPLVLGDTDISRDWGWAPDYVEAMWEMTQQPSGGDYIVATGRTESLRYFIERVFCEVGLRAESHVVEDRALFRPAEIRVSRANPDHIRRTLGWQHKLEVDDVAREMVQARLAILKQQYSTASR